MIPRPAIRPAEFLSLALLYVAAGLSVAGLDGSNEGPGDPTPYATLRYQATTSDVQIVRGVIPARGLDLSSPAVSPVSIPAASAFQIAPLSWDAQGVATAEVVAQVPRENADGGLELFATPTSIDSSVPPGPRERRRDVDEAGRGRAAPGNLDGASCYGSISRPFTTKPDWRLWRADRC